MLMARRGVSLKPMTPGAMKISNDNIDAIRESGVAQHALKTGAIAPSFVLTNTHGTAISLDSRLSSGPVVLTFFRGP